MSTPSVETVGALCKRYGPGRLPGAANRTVGTGYALAAAALAAALAFLAVTGVPRLLFGGSVTVTGGLVYFGLLAIPLVVPAAFVGGAAAERLLPATTPYRGPVVGLVATVLTYVVATALVLGLVFASTIPESTRSITVGSAVSVSLLFGAFGFFYTSWVTLPVGVVSGYVHERAVATE